MILVDTSVLIAFFRNIDNETTRTFKTILSRDIPFGINSLIYQELLQGAKTQRDYDRLKKYLQSQRFYHLKEPIDSYAQAAQIFLNCRKKGLTIRSTIDCLIAQTAIEHELRLLHHDSDFISIAKVSRLTFYS